MAAISRNATSRTLEHLAGELHSLAFDYEQPANSIDYADRRIARAEQIASDIRATVRGGSLPRPR